MRESKKRKVKTTKKLESMAKHSRLDEVLQKISLSILGTRLPEGYLTPLHARSHRRKASPEPASVPSSYQMKTSKKRKMAETILMLELKKKHQRPRQDKVQQWEIRSLVLPDDLIIEIILRLPTRSVGKFQCVSKSWLSIATNPSIKTHFERSRIARQMLVNADPDSYMKPHSKMRLYDASIKARIHLREFPPLEMLNQSSLLTSCD